MDGIGSTPSNLFEHLGLIDVGQSSGAPQASGTPQV